VRVPARDGKLVRAGVGQRLRHWSYFGWGASGHTLVPADYGGDGRTDAAIYRAGTWYVRPSSGAAQWNAAFGNPGDLPLVSIR
jgi:hypothetical protein